MVGKALGGLVGLATVLACAAPASADLLYYANGNHISYAAVDGSGGGDLNTSGATVNGASGTTLDPAHGRVYWINASPPHGPFFANLDGSGGGGPVKTTGATITEPYGVAIDPVANRIYWANCEADNMKIAYANLDGSGGHDLDTGDATVECPQGVAVDPAAGLIYWANGGGAPHPTGISEAHLDGSGGRDLVDQGQVSNSNMNVGVAVDPVNQRIWWTNQNANTIWSSNLAGGAQHTLNTSATVRLPGGVALDPGAGRLYWPNQSNLFKSLSFASFDGDPFPRADINRGPATMNPPSFPSLLKPPAGTAPPGVSGASTTGSTLSCTTGGWAADLVPAFLYQAPTRFAYQWSRNGAAIGGATAATVRTDDAGDYRCAVTASDQAGSTTQTSGALAVTGGSGGAGGSGSSGSSGGSGGVVPPPGLPTAQPILPPSNGFSVGRVRGRVLSVTVTSHGTLAVTDGGARATSAAKRKRKRAPATLKPSQATGGPGTVSVALRLTRQASAKLKRRGRLRVAARLTFTPSGGAPATQKRTLALSATKRRR